jgi:phospholipase/carboxylesterase
LRPGVLTGAALLRAMVPLTPEVLPKLNGISVLMLSGRYDPVVAEENARRLAALLTDAGATVSLHFENAAHQLTENTLEAVRGWLDAQPS